MSKEQLIQIETLYKQALPLPNPDIHETIGTKIDLAPSKVFFGINLIRDKMKLPKLEYPKRRLAVTPEQLVAIETLYDIYMPLPPVGVHKIIGKQLKMDEWRVHVAIGLIRKNRNMNRWNEDRDDIPDQMKVPRGKKPHPEGANPPPPKEPKLEGAQAEAPKPAPEAAQAEAPKPEAKSAKPPKAEKPAAEQPVPEPAPEPEPVAEHTPEPEPATEG